MNSVEAQLREAYATRHAEGKVTQASLARDLGVGRSVIHRRLMGGANLTLKSIADLLWALGHDADVTIFPSDRVGNNRPKVAEPEAPATAISEPRAFTQAAGTWTAAEPRVTVHVHAGS